MTSQNLKLQQDLDEVFEWCQTWHMKLNFDKCEHMQVSSKRNSVVNQYNLDNKTLSKVSSYKYLGLTISDDLNWNTHINTVINKANKVLYVTKLALSQTTTLVKEAAYKAVVRPLLEYSSSVWDPHQTGQIKAVEMVQRRAARFCLSRYQKTDSVSSMIAKLNWNSLSARRRASRLTVFFRAYNGDTCVQDISSKIIKAPCEKLRHVHSFRVQNLNCHKNIGHYSFLPRTIRDWNCLPQNLINQELIDNPSSFRATILNHG